MRYQQTDRSTDKALSHLKGKSSIPQCPTKSNFLYYRAIRISVRNQWENDANRSSLIVIWLRERRDWPQSLKLVYWILIYLATKSKGLLGDSHIFSHVLRDSMTHFVCRSVRQSVGRSVGPHFTFFLFLRSLASPLLPKCSSNSITAPAHPHATEVAVYPALFKPESADLRVGRAKNQAWECWFEDLEILITKREVQKNILMDEHQQILFCVLQYIGYLGPLPKKVKKIWNWAYRY